VKGYALKATGVELNSARHDAAVRLASELLSPSGIPYATSSSASFDSGARFIQGDMLDVDFSDATVIYVNQACYPSHVTKALLRKILNEAPKLKAVLSARPLEPLEASGKFVRDKAPLSSSSRFLDLPMMLYNYGTPLSLYWKSEVRTDPIRSIGASA